ncbi:alpha-tocopherol transfer protein-like [Stomoxys calcitrans]|uniref:CRAL-TRIO domain-containing protein n=1 Tax=Stomoxys calcitrans TaxID=35570 RepID=A0A1I8PDS7_STOCA|nr:alpha-tocopherol transfer protein-like [Stomoxys calcitrans]XP_013105685.1 alpha-tocopherol transfer protein-like [Stomoxys calcitrans]
MEFVHPTPEQRVTIREELREPENVEEVERDLKKIREWLDTQPHLPKDMDDVRLTNFFRGCKFSMEKVKKKLDMYYTMRNAIPEFFSERDIARPELDIVLDYAQITTLPGLTPNGRRITFIRGIDCDFQSSQVNDAMKVSLMLGDVRLAEECVGIAGDIFILDAAVATATHFAKFSPTAIKKFLICVQEAYPVKVKEVHVFNTSPLVDTIFKFVKPFVKEKLIGRVTFHKDLESLYKSVPRDLLPNEYGGKAGSIDDYIKKWKTTLGNYTEWFKEQEAKKANESLRPGSPKTCDDLFGMEGSFRQLNID